MSNSEIIFQEKVMAEDSSNIKNSGNIVQCKVCSEKFALVQGTILFDGDWFHEKCWESVEKEMMTES